MPFLNWDDSLDTGVTRMNDEHKVLIDLMNHLYDLNEVGSAKPTLQKAIQSLVDYTVKHFEDEENYMESIGFSGLKTHKIIHKQLLDKVTDFQRRFSDGHDTILGNEFFDFLRNWLIAHIKGIDIKYSDYP